jgi:hypothetical protein
MIGVFLTFRYGDNFDEQAVRKIADTARPSIEFVQIATLVENRESTLNPL